MGFKSKNKKNTSFDTGRRRKRKRAPPEPAPDATPSPVAAAAHINNSSPLPPDTPSSPTKRPKQHSKVHNAMEVTMEAAGYTQEQMKDCIDDWYAKRGFKSPINKNSNAILVDVTGAVENTPPSTETRAKPKNLNSIISAAAADAGLNVNAFQTKKYVDGE